MKNDLYYFLHFRVSLELNDLCHRSNSAPLATSTALVEVNFTSTPTRSEFTQNDSVQGLNSLAGKGTFRKNGRKDRKKEGQRGQSSNVNANNNDITGIPLKDDSSKASVSSQPFGPITVGFIPDKGWTFAAHNTPLEIAMYVLLGVFSVAILVFVASCFVYASRVKKRDFSGAEDLMGFKMEHFHHGHGQGTFGIPGRAGSTNAHDWVWLGRASLALHPSLEGGKRTGLGGAFGPTSANQGGPIRIITNPNFEQASQAHTPSTPGSVSSRQRALHLQQSAPPRPPKPTSATNSIDSATFSVKRESLDEAPEYRPPVPPHRNIGEHSSRDNKEPVAQTSTNPFAMDFSAEKRPRPVPLIVGNPMAYIDEESEAEEDVERPLTSAAAASAIAARQRGSRSGQGQGQNSSVKLDINYDMMMEYFDNLKETEA